MRHSLRLVTAAWMVGVVWSICVGGDQMRAFAHILGFSDFAFGLMSAIPFIATLGQLPAAIIVERTGLRKYLWFNASIVSRMLWMVLAAVPLIFWPGRQGSTTAVVLALGIIFISNFLAHLSTPPWLTWMGDLIPRRIRGRYFAKRVQLSTAVQIVAIIVISLILRSVGTTHGGNENAVDDRTLLITICVIFAVGAILGTVDILLFRKVREIRPPRNQEFERPSFVFNVARPERWTLASGTSYGLKLTWRICEETLVDPLRDRVFRNYVCYGAVITFSMTCCGWFYWKFASETLGFDALASNIVFLAIGPVAASLTSPWWGKMIDRWGRRPTLIVSTVLMAVSTVPWFVMWRGMPCPQFMAGAINAVGGAVGWFVQLIQQRVHWVWPAYEPSSAAWVWVTAQNRGFVLPYVLASLGCIMGASSGTAVGLASNAIVLGFSDGHGRSKYVAASSILINIGGALGGVVGGLVAESFKNAPCVIVGIVLNNYQLTFVLGMLLRLVSLGLLWNMPDPGARKVREMLKIWTDSLYNVVTSGMFLSLRLVGWGRSSKDEDRRRRAGDEASQTVASGVAKECETKVERRN